MMTIDLTMSIPLNKISKGQALTVFEDKILGITQSPSMGTVVLMAGGVSLPVTETKEEILKRIADAKQGGK